MQNYNINNEIIKDHTLKYHKAVRDKIPEIIADSGRHYTVKILANDEFLIELEKKLNEEVLEYQKSKSIEELADILEVVFKIAQLKGTSLESLEKIRNNKVLKCGKFEKNVFLIDAET